MSSGSINTRFRCVALTQFETQKEARFNAALGPGNEAFAAAEPSGDIRIAISPGMPAGDFFVPGTVYDLTFTKSESQN